MGLDTVELVMAVEEEFQIQIPDSAAAEMITVGKMYDYVLEQLRSRGEPVVEAELWNKLRDLIVEQIGVRLEEVVPSAEFIRDLRID